MRKSSGWLLAVLLIGGVVVGALIAQATKNAQYLSWLSYACSFGVSPDKPMILDLSVIRVAFGFEMGISIAQVLCLLAAVLLYRRLR
jgi:hypothetical protein